MIIVVEGISASGKSSWCRQHAGGTFIPENMRSPDEPDRIADPSATARFWAARNARRWQAARAVEETASVAVCDTDPLKLHYIWTLWQIGEASEGDWLANVEATRSTLAEGRMGFADHYLVATIDPEVARARAAADPLQRRRRFELHVRLQPALLVWYETLGKVLPGRVHFGLPDHLPRFSPAGPADPLAVFDALTGRLPHSPAGPPC